MLLICLNSRPDLFALVGKRLANVIFNIYDVTDWNEIILPNIWRSKGKHTIKFGQLEHKIEYNMRNIFLKNYAENGLGNLQSFKRYLRRTLVFVWNSALREKATFCFSRDCYYYWQNFQMVKNGEKKICSTIKKF